MFGITRYAPHLILLGGVLISSLIIVASGAIAAIAQENTITFPVAELGNCTDKASCKAYCNDSEHITECIAFAEAHGLMKKEEATIAKKFAQTIKTQGGPGGCTDPQSCKAYCENIEHIEECIAFADSSGHADADVEEGRKVAKFIKTGGQMPGGCTSRQSCEAYCSSGDHMEECIAFAEGAGLEIREPDGRQISIEQIKKVHAMMKGGETPGGCKSKQECESFCENPDNSEQCLSFAERAGFMPQEEIARARKMMQNGGPGGCRGRDACESFCRNPENQEQCMAFAEESGMMRPEDGQRMREMRATFEQGMQQMGPRGENGGPGGPGPGIGNCVREKITSIMTSGGVPNQGIMQGVVQECMAQTGNPGQFGDSEGLGGEGFEGMGPEQGRMMGRPFEDDGEFQNQFQQQSGQQDRAHQIQAGVEEQIRRLKERIGGEGGDSEEFEKQAAQLRQQAKDALKELEQHSGSSEGASGFPGRPKNGKEMPFNPEDAKRFMGEGQMHDIRGMMEGGMMPKPPHEGQGDLERGESMLSPDQTKFRVPGDADPSFGDLGTGHREAELVGEMGEGSYQNQFDQQYQQQFQQQFQQEYQNQYQGMTQPPGGMMPPPDGRSYDMTMPPFEGSGGMMPPDGFVLPPGGDGGETSPPPQSIAPMNRMVAGVFQAVIALFGFK